MLEMEYNSQRPKMIIPEYGRNIQKMVDFAVSVEEREERNKVARAIIKVMGQLNPHLRDIEEFKPKLWAHLFLMSGYKLDVDCPYPVTMEDSRKEKPDQVPYPENNIRYGHYGKTVQLLIEKAITYEDGGEKDALVLTIANLMKKSYLMWNRDSVNDEVIIEQLDRLSNGKLMVKDPSLITPTQELLKLKKKNNNSSNSKNKHKKHKKRH